ncbi:MAG: type IV pilus assembly protein PilM [Candidatus Eisenbacteria bacterium]|nr:type IV pilus assembly protein PilM [Candidatus Eisenbacteria bacterium]
MRKTEQHRGLVGIDVGSTSVKLVELSSTPNGFELENISVVAVPDDASASAYGRAMSLVLEGKDLMTSRAATSLSGRKVAVRGMRFPALGKAELDGALRYEGSQVIAFDLHDSYLDHCVIESETSTSKLMDVLFVAARKEAVDARLSMLEGVGLEPRVVGVDALVLLDALLLEEGLPETCGVINIGASSTSIGIARKGTVPFVRDIEIGGNNYTQAIATALSVSLEDAEKAKIMEPERELACARAIEHVTRQLVGELSRSLMYYQTRGNGTQVDSLFMCGGASSAPGLGDAISEMAGLQVVSWSPLDRVHVDDTRFDAEAVKRLAPVSSLAAALAMKKDPN